MKTITFSNFHLLDGTKEMKDTEVKFLEVKEGKISRIGDFEPDSNSEIIDLNGKYVMPGLINLHSHLPSSGKVGKKKLGDARKLVKLILSNGLTKKIGLAIEKKNAQLSLFGGVTTVRTVGGIGNIDSVLRDKINSGKILGPRLLVANTAIGVPGGHMDGTVAAAVNNAEEAKKFVDEIAKDKVDLIKLMITGGVLDGKEPGKPAQLRMPAEIVKACCDEAHKLGFQVAAHVESPEGTKVAIENGVDTIEHGSDLNDELVNILKKRNGALVATISPALPLASLPADATPYGEIGKINSQVVLDGIVSGAKMCLANGIKVGLGTDAGSSFVLHYNFWRELPFFCKYCGVEPSYALYTATLGNAEIVGIDKETGSVEVGKSADLLISNENPLENKFKTLADPYMVMIKGNLIKNPKIKKVKEIDDIVDKLM